MRLELVECRIQVPNLSEMSEYRVSCCTEDAIYIQKKTFQRNGN